MILLPKPPKVVSKKENSATFEIEALYPGYGITVANSLRRVLLSSLPGAAITQIKIKGVQHEYSTIPGVAEDVITIVMNLKHLRFKVYESEPVKATLKIKGEKDVKGSDIKLPSQVELINKSEHIATTTSKSADLDIEIQIEKGIGYEPVENRKKRDKLEIGVIPVDAIFTPIQRVNYKVENMRVGDRTDFDKVTLDIITDGTITSEEALFEASKILVEHFSLFVNTLEPKETKKEPVPAKSSGAAKKESAKKKPAAKKKK
jgi:DNA-directed RNA polymerase subunit alpha